MTARSPSAYVVSMILHGVFVAVMIVSAVVMRDDDAAQSKVFDLVMGDGNDISATVAAQAGRPDGSDKIELPPPTPIKVPPRPVVPQPAPEPDVVEPAPVAPVKTPAPKLPDPKPVVTKVPDAAKTTPKISIEEYRKLNPAKAPSVAKATGPIAPKLLDPKAYRIGVANGANVKTDNTKGGASGKALTAEEGNLLEKYFQLLRNSAKANHTPPPGAADGLETEVRYTVAPNGAISNVQVVRSSGSREFDQSAVEAFRTLESVGRVPDGKSHTRTTLVKARDTQ